MNHKEKINEDGKLVKQVVVSKGHRQLVIALPVFLQEIFGVEVGDKFNWYVKRRKDKVSLRAVFVKHDNSLKYFKEKNK